MGTLRRPVGPLPASVYWFRRGVVLLILLALGLLLHAVWPGGDARSASTTASAASPTPGEVPVVRACADSPLTVTLASDPSTYPYSGGASPRFTVTVRNAGSVACRGDLGAAAITLTVTSGGEHVWSSHDCRHPDASAVVTLVPGGTHRTTVGWDRRLSSPGCSKARLPAGPGKYVVAASTGTATSPNRVVTLT